MYDAERKEILFKMGCMHVYIRKGLGFCGIDCPDIICFLVVFVFFPPMSRRLGRRKKKEGGICWQAR